METQLPDGMESLKGRLAQLSPEQRKVLQKLLGAEKTPSALAPVIVHRDRDKIPLSFAQQRLWFLNQLLTTSPIYNIPWALRLTFPLNAEVLQRSLNEVVRRHEALRTTFVTVDGQPQQVIAPELKLELEVKDLSEVPAAEREAEAVRLAAAAAQEPFDLERGPLVRTSLLRLGAADYVLLLAMHHIVTDGWSMGIFFQELTTLYNAFAVGQPSPLPELAIQYADYAVWQREWLQGDVLQEQLSYWEEQLRELSLLQLPTDRPRPAVQSFRGAQQSLEIDAAQTAALRQLSQREGVTPFMTLLAAFKVLLYRYTGQHDIVVGTPIAGRNRAEIEQLIGFFVNTLVLRTKIHPEHSFQKILQNVRGVCVGAFTHQEVPFEMLVEKLQPDRDLTRNPLFQVMLQLQSERSSQKGSAQGPALLNVNRASAIFDLAFNFWETAEEIQGQIEYNTDLFDAATIARLSQHYLRVLSAMAANPEQTIGSFELLSAAESEQQLHAWNQTAADYQRESCIHELFEQQVEWRPEAVALVCGAEEVSYEEVNGRANQLAHYLRAQGIGTESLVGVMVERSVAMVVSVLGILKAGAAYVPLDPGYPQGRLRYMMADAGMAVVVTQASVAEKLNGSAVRAVKIDEQWSEISQHSRANPGALVRAENLAYVIYTSGSTGNPKGVMVAHRSLSNVAESQLRTFGQNASDRVLQFSSLSFDASIFEMLIAIRAGATLCLVPQESVVPGLELSNLLREQRVTIVTLPPSAMMALPVEELPALRLVTVAGEACPAELVGRWARGRRFINLYGPTEAAIWSSFSECMNGGVKPTIGRPISNVEIYILDRHLQPTPIGVAGQLFIGGDGVARGYLARPELTAEKFIPDPFSGRPGARLYQSGDLARFRESGEIEFLGRLDTQVKLRGYRIELEEIETLLKEQAGIRDAVVIVHGNVSSGQKIVAYIVADEEPSLSELRSKLSARLPQYMVPAVYRVLKELPLTPNGKVDRRALPALDASRPQLEVKFVAPRTHNEEEVAKIWANVLGIGQVGIHDNFFDLGGHSLLATQLISRIREQFQVDVALRHLFETPTVAGLVENIELLQWATQKVDRSEGEYEEGEL